ncbi:hypothetical protein BUALT_Bualt06G0047100 [Buddleja alternifolia]|uniref:Uncharacterized protein n=1 Tax=Buddleja alternifolia TaxID=168488 RepID=A0AAV6XCZ2_9LAMI|nr:hypothetical protein BUALT_Bualt06G0047100 [Buddleja alternifolia]
MDVEAEEEYVCRTPQHARCKIPAATVCPVAPRKKQQAVCLKQQHTDPPKDGYFKTPDIELFFALASTRKATSSHSPTLSYPCVVRRLKMSNGLGRVAGWRPVPAWPRPSMARPVSIFGRTGPAQTVLHGPGWADIIEQGRAGPIK